MFCNKLAAHYKTHLTRVKHPTGLVQEPDWRLIGLVQQQEEQEGPKPEPILPGSKQPGWVQTGRSTKRTCSKAPQKQVNLLFGPETGKQTSLEITDIKSFNLTEKVDNDMVKT